MPLGLHAEHEKLTAMCLTGERETACRKHRESSQFAEVAYLALHGMQIISPPPKLRQVNMSGLTAFEWHKAAFDSPFVCTGLGVRGRLRAR